MPGGGVDAVVEFGQPGGKGDGAEALRLDGQSGNQGAGRRGVTGSGITSVAAGVDRLTGCGGLLAGLLQPGGGRLDIRSGGGDLGENAPLLGVLPACLFQGPAIRCGGEGVPSRRVRGLC